MPGQLFFHFTYQDSTVNHLFINKFELLSFQSKVYSFSCYVYFCIFQLLPGIALFQIIESVEDKINSSVANAIPVFMMKYLCCLYQEIFQNLDAPEEIINNVNATRLKEEILKQAIALCEQRNDKFILLTLDKYVVKALFDVTQNSHKDGSIVLHCFIKMRYSMSMFLQKEKKNLYHHHCFI